MSVVEELAHGVPTARIGAVMNRVQDVGHGSEPALSVFLDVGVVPRSERSDNHNSLGSDLDKYQLVQPGDLVFNRLRTWQGGFGASRHRGIVSPAYIVTRPKGDGDARYLDYVLHSAPYLAELTRVSKWMPPSQFDVLWSDLRNVLVPWPARKDQQRIADFLDDRVARIDQIIAARLQQRVALETALLRASFDTITGTGARPRKESGIAWLGTIPASWPVLPVAMDFQVDLGKMLDEKRQDGEWPLPYLRNTNVQWDRVDISDMKTMDIHPRERDRFCVRPGDLLICEGGQPGRAAVWDGDVGLLGFQKALHRARSRGRSHPEWLLECLRVAAHLNVFAVENGQTTIGHLTNVQLRALRLPLPDRATQTRALGELQARQARGRVTMAALGDSIELLHEYKQSLITAAVTGELDVSTAGSGIPG